MTKIVSPQPPEAYQAHGCGPFLSLRGAEGVTQDEAVAAWNLLYLVHPAVDAYLGGEGTVKYADVLGAICGTIFSRPSVVQMLVSGRVAAALNVLEGSAGFAGMPLTECLGKAWPAAARQRLKGSLEKAVEQPPLAKEVKTVDNVIYASFGKR